MSKLVLSLKKIKLETMKYKTRKILVITLDVILWGALIFFGFKYFTGC